MNVLDPLGSSAAGASSLAPRPASLRGVVVGVLDNERAGARGVRVFGKLEPQRGADPALLDEVARQCGLVLTFGSTRAITRRIDG